MFRVTGLIDRGIVHPDLANACATLYSMVLIGFLVFLIGMTGIGLLAAKHSRGTASDYILADRSLGPIATALSAVSTCHSGFMFIGLIGFTYRMGISAIWLIVAWLIGDLVAWRLVYPRLRQQTADMGVSTIVGFVSQSYSHPWVRPLLALFVLVFLSVYAAAQITAGSKALWIMLGWPHIWGSVMGALIVVAYSFSGGIRASVWTDVAQSMIMFISMIGLATVALIELGGLSSLWQQLSQIDPHLIRLIPTDLTYGFGWYAVAWVAFGVGVIAQPHIVTRPMAIADTTQLHRASIYYILWYTVFSLGAICVGLAARVLLPELIAADPEIALPFLADNLLPSLFVGGMLAGIFSATISTADSQVIACSAVITQDMIPSLRSSYVAGKLLTLIVMLLALMIALFGSQSVYALVIIGWSSFAAVLGPLVFLNCMGVYLTQRVAVIMMLSSFATVILWQHLGLSGAINETLPGIVVASVIVLVSRYRWFR